MQEGQASIVLRFGEYKQLIDRAGFTWRLPYPFESHEIVNVQRLRQVEVGYRSSVRNKMLKRVADPDAVTRASSTCSSRCSTGSTIRQGLPVQTTTSPSIPEELIRQVAESAMREVIGRRMTDEILYEEKAQVARGALKMIQSLVDRYQAGISVVDVTIQQVQPPEQVQAAFEDANKAAQDRERLINEGRAYANDVIPKVRGTAARLMQEADGYRQRVIASAEGDTSRFRQVLAEYAKAPQVTRERMYLETMQEIFTNTSKVYVDSRASNNLLYLPLDRLMQHGAGCGDRTRAPARPRKPAAPSADRRRRRAQQRPAQP